jgi:hypothetical protein
MSHNIIHGHAGCGWKEHGGSPTYISWLSMRKRCSDPSHDNYRLYGGRGIKVCERWLNSFENFLADMGERPKGRFLEREDNDGNYKPSNCKWATRSEQARNRRTNHLLTFQGRTQPLIAWAEETGISRLTLRSRLREGWSTERALQEPTNLDRSLVFHGVTRNAADWARRFNIKPATLLARIRKGWPIERALLGEVK